MTAEGKYRTLDLETWPRREQYEMFKDYGFPYFSITAEMDITAYRRALPRGGRFTIGIVYAIAEAANHVPEFRQRIRGNDVIGFEVVHPAIIVLNDQDAFRFSGFPYHPKFEAFAKGVPERIEAAKLADSMYTAPDQDDFLFLTGLPWISFVGVTHAAPIHAPDSVPRIAWGKYKTDGDRIMMPLNVQAHHALIDGIHVARFYERFEDVMARVGEWLVY